VSSHDPVLRRIRNTLSTEERRALLCGQLATLENPVGEILTILHRMPPEEWG
jgi:hypothetical protein